MTHAVLVFSFESYKRGFARHLSLILVEKYNVGHAVKNPLHFFSFFPSLLICVFSTFYILVSIFVSRFCFSPSLCSSPPAFIQTFTASAARQNTCKPKVCLHTVFSSRTHACKHTLISTASFPSQHRLAPCSPLARKEVSLLVLCTPSPGALKPCEAWRRISRLGLLRQPSPPLSTRITATRMITGLTIGKRCSKGLLASASSKEAF